MATSDTRPKLAKLMDVLIDLDEKRAAVMAEMVTLLNGGDGIGARLKKIEAHFSACREERYPGIGVYEFNYKADRPHLKRWLQHHADEEIMARMYRYVHDGNPFHEKNKHPFSLFVRGFNTYGAPKVIEGDSGESAARLREMRGQA